MEKHGFGFMNHFRPLFSILILLIMMIPVLYWFNFEKFAIVILGILFLIDFLPALYLHLQYWSENRGEEYSVNENEIIRYTESREEVFKTEDIAQCIIYKSASIDTGSWITLFAIEEYHYARLLLRTGDELIITCLLMPKMDRVLAQLKGVQFERKKRGFNPLWWK